MSIVGRRSRGGVRARRGTEWNELAGLDPLWAVLGEPARRPGFDLDAFFASGEIELSQVLARAASLGAPQTFARALDVGCGLGRVVRAMSGRFGACIGIDISERMIVRARELNADLPNCRFCVTAGPELGFDSHSFDFVYSRLVLQHLSRRAEVVAYVAEFLRLLRPGGLVVFQMPRHLPWRNRIQPRRRLWAALRSAGVPPRILHERLGLHPVRLIAVPSDVLRATIERSGGVLLLTEPDDEAAPPAPSVRYYARPA